MQLQGELGVKKKEVERWEQRIQELFKDVSSFGDHVVIRVMRLDKVAALRGCGGGLRNDMSNLKEFLSILQDIITQGCTNLKLQLETPINGHT